MGLRRPGGDDQRARCSRSGRCCAFGTEEQQAAVPAAARVRGGLPRRDRLHRAAGRLRRQRDARRPRRRDGRRVRAERREVLRHERRDRRADDRLRASSRRDHGVPARGGRPGRRRPAARSRSSACAPRTPARSCSRTLASRPTGCWARRAQGFAIAMDFFQHSRPQVAAGARRDRARRVRVRDRLRARARGLRQADPDRKQGVSFKLADMAMEIEAARLLVWRACAALDAGEDAGLLGSYAKAFAADAAMRVTTDAVQVLGGAGIMRDHPVEKWLRDAKVLPDRRGHVRDPAARDRSVPAPLRPARS